MSLRDWYTIPELAGLPGLPGTVRGVRKLADRLGWEGQRRLGSKAIEYSVALLPKEAQNALLVAQLGTPPAPVEAPEPVAASYVYNERDGLSASRLTDDQRAVMTARLAFIREIERMSQAVTQQRAIETLVELARTGELSPYLMERVERANDRKTADRALSERTLKRWLTNFRRHGEVGLAPERRKKDMSVPSWAGDFLKHYQRPQKPSVEAAYIKFCTSYWGDTPSIYQVRRFLKKLSPEARERGRRSAQELKALQAFNRRQADMLWPNDVWVADGHTFDAEVLNPINGQIFRPEITLVIDWGTRRIVGFSVNLAESTIATLDTLRDGVTRCGMYRALYVDNGSGFDNAVVYEVNDRLGGHITHSLPYNSQARGVIERPHRTILVRLAKTYDSYIGADMDKQAATKAHRLSRKQLAAGLKPTPVPEFAEFFADLQQALDTYNHRPHRGLPKVRDLETARRRHQSPMECWKSAEAEGWEPLRADPEVVASLTRPQVTRKTARGEIRWNGGIYFHTALVDLHGEEIRVAYDFRDSSQVWAFSAEGELICTAVLDGNASPAMQTVLEKAGDKRVKGQLGRLTKKATTLTGEEVELRVIPRSKGPQYSDEQLLEARQYAAAQIALQQPSGFQLPGDSVARYRFWKQLDRRDQGGEPLSEQEAHWHGLYPTLPEYKSMRDLFDAAPEQQARA
ncbi:MAG: Mu transposase C-terminal domain-containing protein [Pseudomonas sp.]|nr:Mu transposase C-terminal domain-containing protein [Pseudomonas sp.]